ncbi:MAG: 3-methylornithine--L-lysine ligase [Methanomassiliicoccales archaeon PtaU1.Bin030]|jgi:pyrrolysine biosynthesis protein PylC|nr:MAG: 3-methylornithine--L-lysine ligase [Methanomassiliicoccales archaeon PtaU1.Bin030]
MRLGIVGGVLQGMEAAYLAGKAGYQTVVIDRWDKAPALSIGDEAIVLDVVKDQAGARRVFSDCDAVIPANENIETLRSLDRMFRDLEVPLLFDMSAYEISSSKVRSNGYLKGLGLPIPRPWPECGYPVVVKPSGQSGSVGVLRATNEAELESGISAIQRMNDDPVVQEFIDGPNISVEVIGDGIKAAPMVLTEILLDEAYDCRMVRCPLEGTTPELESIFGEYSRRLAEGLSLRGIMDVEAIVQDGVPKILEIDARIPSQTPAAVYHATGINLLERLVEALVFDKLEEGPAPHRGAAVYEHILVDSGIVRSCGEGSFSQVRDPRIEPGLFGSDEMITDYLPDKETWRATIICSGRTSDEAWAKRLRCLERIQEHSDLASSQDRPTEVYP